MQKLNKSIRLLFAFSLALSVGFPVGVLCIIFGAVNGIIPLLVTGIVLTVLGFYLMPILWLKYAERRGDRSLLFMVEHDGILTVDALARQSGYSADDVRNRLKRMIVSRALIGYLLDENDTLINMRVKKQAESIAHTKKCACCGAPMVYENALFKCEYCGHNEGL